VTVKQDFPIGELFLLPETTTVKTEPAEKRTSDLEPVGFEPADDQNVYTLQPCTAKENVAPYWCVGFAVEAEKANMTRVKAQVGALWGVDFVGGPAPLMARINARGKARAKAKAKAKTRERKADSKGKRKAVAEDEAVSDEDDTTATTYTFSVLFNHKPLKAGDELLLAPAAAKPPRPQKSDLPITVTQVLARAAKRSRVPES
jgi:hypothetical protein